MNTAIVLGVGRCGSSMVAGILHHLGAYMGKIFVEADDFNKRGYWEDITIMGLQDRMLHMCGRSWWNPPEDECEIRMALEQSPANQSVYDRLISTFGKRMDQASANGQFVWGFKDPRTYMFLSMYIDQLPNPHLIFVHRDPLAIANSVFKRDKGQVKTLDGAIALVNRHYSQLMMFSEVYKEVKQLHVGYRDILDMPDEFVLKIGKFVGLGNSRKALNDAEDFIDPYLRTW